MTYQQWAAVSAQIAARRAPRGRAWHAIGAGPAACFLVPLTAAVVAFVAFAVSVTIGG